MTPKKSITEIFNQFAGKEIQVVETTQNFVIGGKNYPVTDVTPASNEPTLQAMKNAAAQNGLKLRVWFPGTVGTMDFRTDRVNAHVNKGADGKYRVQNNFNIG